MTLMLIIPTNFTSELSVLSVSTPYWPIYNYGDFYESV